MKPKSTLRHFLAVAGSSLLAISSASAAPFTWTQTADGNQDWTTAGNWDGNNQFVSGPGNELIFFADTTTTLPTGFNQTIISVPSTLSMNTLTLNGKGPNNPAGFTINVGTNASTWTLGDGATSTVNLNSTLGGGTSDRDVRYTIAANLALTGDSSGITTFTGNSTSATGAVFSGDITETSAGQGITKSGSSLLVLSGNNTYTGTTLVTGGVLRLASANALSGGTGATGGTSALTINGGVVALGAGDFNRGLGTGSSQFQITGGTSGFSSFGGPSVITVNGDASQEVVWGSASFDASTFVLNSSVADSSLTFANKIDLGGSTRTVQVNAENALLSGDVRTSSGTAGLTKNGNGMLVLTGNNTYNGNTTVNAGALSVGESSNLGSGASGLILNTATLQVRGTTLTSLSGLGHTVTINNGNKGFDIHNVANTFTVDQALNNGSLTKAGVGTLVLNQDNNLSGATTAGGGGTLVLDYTTNNGSKLRDASALIFNGSALVLKGGSHTEVVFSTSLSTNNGISASNSISRDGGTSKISLGAITWGSNTYSTLAISEANLAITTTANNASGILNLGRVTVGSHFGANDGSNNIVAYSGYTAATTAGGGNTSTVNELTGGGTMAANLSSYSLRIANSGNSDVLDLNTRNLLLSNNGTLLYAGGSDNQYTINGTTGYINSNSGNQPFIINTYAGTTLTVNAQLGFNFGGFAKAGTGTLVVGAENTKLAGAKYIQQGVLRLTDGGGLGTDYGRAQSVSVQGGAALELSNNIAVGAQTLALNGAGISNGGALRNVSGNNSYAGAITTGLSGARINSDAGSLTLTGGIATTLTQDATFGGAGDTTVSTTGISGGGSVTKDGTGTLTLSATNTYTGETTVSAGTLYVTGALSKSATSVQANGAIGSNGAAGTLGNGLTIAAGGNLDLTGASLASNSNGILSLTGGSLVLGNLTFEDLIGWNWMDASAGTYELIDGSFSVDFGDTAFLDENTAYDFGNGKGGYFTSGSLNAVVFVIPEPSTALLAGLGLLALLRRRR